jgi:hypothetical protein
MVRPDEVYISKLPFCPSRGVCHRAVFAAALSRANASYLGIESPRFETPTPCDETCPASTIDCLPIDWDEATSQRLADRVNTLAAEGVARAIRAHELATAELP